MILYHGTTLEIKKPEIITSEIGNDQIAFCTEKALSTLEFVESYVVEG